MTWWLRARGVPVLGAGLLLTVLAVGLFSEASTPLISWTVSRQTVPVLTFAPLILAATLAFCLDSRLPEAELTAIRRVPVLDTMLILATTTVTEIIALVAYILIQTDETLILGRNTLFLTGLMLIARAVIGRGGIVVATGWVLVVILIGRRTPTEYFPWAVTGLPLTASHATLTAIAAFVLGALMTHLTARKLP